MRSKDHNKDERWIHVKKNSRCNREDLSGCSQVEYIQYLSFSEELSFSLFAKVISGLIRCLTSIKIHVPAQRKVRRRIKGSLVAGTDPL